MQNAECKFTVKVMGKETGTFKKNVQFILRKHFPDITEAQFKENASSAKNYLAISISLSTYSKAQLDALYQDLSAEPTVLMAL